MPASPRKTPVVIKKISSPKPHVILANQLRETILSGSISEGDSLPPERELVTQTGMTRGSVREALRLLAVEGLVQTRHGRFGGNVVTLPDNESMANAVNLFVRGRKLPLRTLQETREAVEPALARLAAQRRTDDDLLELKSVHNDLVASVKNFQEFSLFNVKWHNAVARASHNDLLAAVLYSLSHGVHLATMVEEFDTMDTRNEVINIHARVNEAIEAGNPDLAERRMRQHLGATHARIVAPGVRKIPLAKGR